jgi:hypothetical protein
MRGRYRAPLSRPRAFLACPAKNRYDERWIHVSTPEASIMNQLTIQADTQIRLSGQHAILLRRLAESRKTSEDQIVEKALDIFFSLTDLFDDQARRQGWSLLSEDSLQRVWDNDADAAYDNWRELYGVPTR